MKVWLQVILIMALASLIVVIISQNRHPVKTIAWILILCLLPIVGLVLYLVFGTQKKRSRLVSDERLACLKEHVVSSNQGMVRRTLPDGHTDIATLLWMTNRSVPLAGNDVKVFTKFDDMYTALMDDLGRAVDHVNFEFFKFEDDTLGRKVGRILIDLSRRGVDVRVTYDSAANLTRGRFYKWLRDGGVKVKAFLPVMIPFLSSSTNYRNHRKVVVIDGKVGYMGGMNIAERYSMGLSWGIWRDTHIRVQGPAVAEMQAAFIVDWQFCSKEFLGGERFFPQIPPSGDSVLQIATSGPMDEWNVTMQGMIRIINQAKKYVYIESPYLIPTDSVLVALRNAALAGVDVRLIIPYRGDKGILVPLATRSYVSEVLVAGVKVYFYRAGYMHSKTIVADGTVATVGSTNLDIRSFEQDFEINAFIYDRKVAAQLQEAFMDDLSRSEEVSIGEWEKRPALEKFKESFARLFSPVL